MSGAAVSSEALAGLVERVMFHNAENGFCVLRVSDLSDAFVALPGGAGALEEIFEQWIWGNLGIHENLSGFLNVNSYLRPILSIINGIIDQIFMRKYYGLMLVVSDDIYTMLSMFTYYTPPARKWSESQSA